MADVPWPTTLEGVLKSRHDHRTGLLSLVPKLSSRCYSYFPLRGTLGPSDRVEARVISTALTVRPEVAPVDRDS